MCKTIFPGRSYLWVLAAAALAGGGFVRPEGPLAQGFPPEADHLKCYQIREDFALRHTEIVDLFNEQFGPETGCQLLTTGLFYCAPTQKFRSHDPDGDDPRGPELQSNFLCYQVRCKANPERSIVVDDQVGQRVIEIQDAKMLCTPTTRVPGEPCEESAPACGGVCPPGETCEASPQRGGCFCE